MRSHGAMLRSHVLCMCRADGSSGRRLIRSTHGAGRSGGMWWSRRCLADSVIGCVAAGAPAFVRPLCRGHL